MCVASQEVRSTKEKTLGRADQGDSIGQSHAYTDAVKHLLPSQSRKENKGVRINVRINGEWVEKELGIHS